LNGGINLKQMNKKIFFLFFTVLFFIFCSNEDSKQSKEYSTPFTEINGEISNWAKDGNYQIKAIAVDHNFTLDSCTIDENGSFSLDFPTPSDSLLKSVSEFLPSGVNASPVTQYCEAELYLYDLSSSGPLPLKLGSVSRQSRLIADVNDFITFLFYTNEDVTFNGTGNETDENVTFKYYFDEINIKKGWNFAVSKIISNQYDSTNNTYQIEIQALLNEPESGRWYFYSDN